MTTNSNPQASTDATDVPTVSGVIDSADGPYRIVRVAQFEFIARGADGTDPVVYDVALAGWIGLPLHKLRQLSGRHEEAGNIAPEVSTTMVETGGRPGRQRLYGEADALFLVTRCETPNAIAMTKKMIRAYMAARRSLSVAPTSGVLSPATFTATVMAMMERYVAPIAAQLDARMDRLEALVTSRTHAHGEIGRDEANDLRAAFRDIADAEHDRKTRAWRSARAKADCAVRKATKHPMGRAWDELDPAALNRARERVTELRAEAKTRAEIRGGRRQRDLPVVTEPRPRDTN